VIRIDFPSAPTNLIYAIYAKGTSLAAHPVGEFIIGACATGTAINFDMGAEIEMPRDSSRTIFLRLRNAINDNSAASRYTAFVLPPSSTARGSSGLPVYQFDDVSIVRVP
jgi:hypothetical protein